MTHDWAAFKRLWAQAQKHQAAQAQRQQQAAQKQTTATPTPNDSELFRRAMQGVHPQAPSDRVLLPPQPATPHPRRTAPSPAADLSLALSDFEPPGLDTEGPLRYHRTDVPSATLRLLRRGHWSVAAELDLHGLNIELAQHQLAQFLGTALAKNWRCVLVIHGKGLSSHQGVPILKHKVRAWLLQRPEVLAFASAPNGLGGDGAVLVLLQQARPR